MQMRRPALKTMSSRAFHSKRIKISVNTEGGREGGREGVREGGRRERSKRWSRKWRDPDMGHYNPGHFSESKYSSSCNSV